MFKDVLLADLPAMGLNSHVSILYMSTYMWTCCMSVLVDMLCTFEHTIQVYIYI